MTTYRAVFTGVNADTAASYEFEAAEDLFNKRGHDIIVEAMESIERSNFDEHHDYEIHSVFRDNGRNGIVGIGNLVSGRGEIPFTISVYEV